MKSGYKFFFTVLIFFFSCNSENKFEEHLKQYYLKTENCTVNGYCAVNIQDITWFNWDTMKFRENDSGTFLDFFHSGKIVYSYYKPTKAFDGASGVEFGFGNSQLENIYPKDSACFDLKVEKEGNDLVYFLLPKSKLIK